MTLASIRFYVDLFMGHESSHFIRNVSPTLCSPVALIRVLLCFKLLPKPYFFFSIIYTSQVKKLTPSQDIATL